MKQVRTAKFRSGTYAVSFNIESIKGYCETPRRSKGLPVLYVDYDQPERLKLINLIHESVHAHDPDASEAYVKRLADDVGDLVWRLGYRLQTEDEST